MMGASEEPSDGSKPGVPILSAVAYPSHVIWVPRKAFGMNVIAWVSLGIVLMLAGVNGGWLFIILGIIATHGWLVTQYRRDVFFFEAFMFRVFRAQPWPTWRWRRRPSLRPQGRYRVCRLA